MKARVIAHKGDIQHAPESTQAAFQSAIEKGADAIEFDVHLTADEQLVVHHDYYLGRTEDAAGTIADFSLAELKQLDIGSWFGSDFAAERMLTLHEVLELGQRKIHFEIDMRTPSLKLLSLIWDELIHFGVKANVELTSVHTPLLMRAKQIDLTVATGVFFSPLPEWMTVELGRDHILGWMKLMEAQVAHLPAALLDKPFIDMLHDHRFLVHGANLNTIPAIENGLMVGINQFSTDILDLAIEVNNSYDRSE